ncbi:MAG: hypothetical protein U1F65_04035 [Verrucomicrobiota bacterium]
MKAKTNVTVLQIKTGVRLLVVILYLAGVVLLSIHLPFGIPDHHRIWLVPTFAVVGLLWLVDIFTQRIVLDTDGIRIVSLSDRQRLSIPRSEIESVTWEKGCGASLKLRDGKWVRLPSVGRNTQGLTNTIRAWLNKT